MRTMFDKAVEDRASFHKDFAYSPVLEQPATNTSLNARALCTEYANFMADFLGSYFSVKKIAVHASPAAIDRFIFEFVMSDETPIDEYVRLMRFWGELKKHRWEDDALTATTSGQTNLPVLSAHSTHLRDILWLTCEEAKALRNYHKEFTRIDALIDRIALGEHPKYRLS